MLILLRITEHLSEGKDTEGQASYASWVIINTIYMIYFIPNTIITSYCK